MIIKKTKDIRIFNHKTNRPEIESLVKRTFPNNFSKEELNAIVSKLLTVYHAISYLKKKYGNRNIDYRTVFGSSSNTEHYTAEILQLAIEEIHKHKDNPTKKLENIVSIFSRTF